MDFVLTDEQLELKATVAAFLDKRLPEVELRRQMETPEGYQRADWVELTGQQQFASIAIPEEYGGLGFGLVELGIVAEELGRVLSGLPLLSSIGLAASAILASDDESAKQDIVPRLASGELIATLVVPETSTELNADTLGVTATDSGTQWTLDGRVSGVLDGTNADLVLLGAAVGDEVGVFAVEADAAGFDRRAEASIDMTRKIATLTLSGTPARLIGTLADGRRIIEEARGIGAVILAAEQVGTAQKSLDIALEYAKMREQFDRPIASFQAIAHILSQILEEVLTARYACLSALWAADHRDEDPEWQIKASLARVRCTEAVNFAASECLQVHGGNGYTWDFPVHLYFRRARATEITLGNPSLHRALMAERLGV